jgi:hypothetical protein
MIYENNMDDTEMINIKIYDDFNSDYEYNNDKNLGDKNLGDNNLLLTDIQNNDNYLLTIFNIIYSLIKDIICVL